MNSGKAAVSAVAFFVCVQNSGSWRRIAMALDIAGELRNLFTEIPYQDIQEVINENK